MTILLSMKSGPLGEDPHTARAHRRPARRGANRLLALGIAVLIASATPITLASASDFECEAGLTLATGEPDRSLFSEEASPGIRAFWCERYDGLGSATRSGPYWETYANGTVRSRATYADSIFDGPVRIHHEDGRTFVRGYLENGTWAGALEIFFPNGVTWMEATFDAGQLEGPVRTRYPDGALESEAWFSAGREHGLARSFYSSAAGGQLKSEAHLEDDQLVGAHRVFDPSGTLVRWIEWDLEPVASEAPDRIRPGPRRTEDRAQPPWCMILEIESSRERDTLVPCTEVRSIA